MTVSTNHIKCEEEALKILFSMNNEYKEVQQNINLTGKISQKPSLSIPEQINLKKFSSHLNVEEFLYIWHKYNEVLSKLNIEQFNMGYVFHQKRVSLLINGAYKYELRSPYSMLSIDVKFKNITQRQFISPEEDPEENLIRCVTSIEDKIRAKPPPKSFDLLFRKAETFVIIHELGHYFEIDANQNNEINRDIRCHHALNITDDPHLYNLPGTMLFDDLGNKTTVKKLVKNGEIYEVLDLNNGNARRMSVNHDVLSRQSNIYLSGGEYSVNEYIKRNNRTKILEVSEVSHCYYSIREKKIYATILAYDIIDDQSFYFKINVEVLNFLENIIPLKDNLRIIPGLGLCCRNGQFVPVGYGGEAFVLSGLNLVNREIHY